MERKQSNGLISLPKKSALSSTIIAQIEPQKEMVARPWGYKTCFMLNSAEHEIFPANKCKMPTIIGIVKMTTIVGFLTFISMINTTSERLIAKISLRRYFSFYEQLKFRAQLS